MDGSNNLTVTVAHNYLVGQAVVLSGFATSTFLNGQTVTITSPYWAISTSLLLFCGSTPSF